MYKIDNNENLLHSTGNSFKKVFFEFEVLFEFGQIEIGGFSYRIYLSKDYVF